MHPCQFYPGEERCNNLPTRLIFLRDKAKPEDDEDSYLWVCADCLAGVATAWWSELNIEWIF
jgi:hypothetical protein